MDGRSTEGYPLLASLYGATLPDWRDLPLWGWGEDAPGEILGSDEVDLAHGHDHAHDHVVDPPATSTSGPNDSALLGGSILIGPTTDHSHTVDIPAFSSGPADPLATDPALGLVDKRPRRAVVMWIVRAE